jgi:hypothetical protein
MRELPSTIEQVHREWGPRGLTVLAVNLGEPRARVADWVREQHVTVRVLLDADRRVADAYRVTSTPTTVLVARDGRMVGRGMGPRPWLADKGRALLEAFVSEPGR